MKKIYNGDQIAAVVLDTEPEIHVVTAALVSYLDGWPDDPAALALLAELRAPAPDKDPRWAG